MTSEHEISSNAHHEGREQLPGLRTYLARVFILATLVIGTALFYISYSSQSAHLEAERINHYQQIQRLILTSSEDAIVAEDLTLLGNVVKDLGKSDVNIASLQITNDEGRVIAEWKTDRAELSDLIKLSPVEVKVRGKSQGTIKLSVDLSYQREVIRSFVIREALITSLMLILLILLVMYLVNQIAIKPVRKIESRLLGIERGDLSIGFEAGGASEFDQLARSINRVADTLQRQLRSEAEARNELQKLNSAYVRFVPEAFLNLLGKEHIIGVNLGDHTRAHLTIMFTDIRSFTPLAERLTAEETFQFINDYFAHLGPIVRQYHGVIDKYIGDAIMALFVSPDDAIDAGIAMLETLEIFNAERVGEDPIRMGIGLHTGEVMLGTIGERFRMEGTVIGDVVNLAARLESLTKTYNQPLLISEATREAAERLDKTYGVEFVDNVLAKGKSEPTRIYSVQASAERLEVIKESISGISSLPRPMPDPSEVIDLLKSLSDKD